MRVIEQGRRANDVVTSLRSLARDAQPRLASVQINDAIEEILLLLPRLQWDAGLSVSAQELPEAAERQEEQDPTDHQ
jgi:hypothetical protein